MRAIVYAVCLAVALACVPALMDYVRVLVSVPAQLATLPQAGANRTAAIENAINRSLNP